VIPGQLQDLFRPGVRARGEEYFAQRRVRIVTATTRVLEARVAGGVQYLARLEASRGLIRLSCTCPYALENGVCKHQWATVREGERKGRLQLLLASSGPRTSFIAGSDTRMDAANPSPTAPRRPEWRQQLEGIRRQLQFSEPIQTEPPASWPEGRRLVYIVDIPASANTTGLVIELATEKQEPDGSWDVLTHFRFGASVWLAAPDPADRQIAQMLLGAPSNEHWPTFADRSTRTNGFIIGAAAFDTTLRLMCETGRCRARMVAGEEPLEPVRWDDGPPWQLHLRIDHPSSDAYELTGTLRRGREEMSISEPLVLHSSGILLARGALARFDHSGAFAFVPLLREASSLHLTAKELPDFLGTLYGLPRLPPIESTTESAVTVVDGHPLPSLSILDKGASLGAARDGNWLRLAFRYGRVRVDGALAAATVFDPASLTVYRRDRDAEAAAEALLIELGAKKEWDYTQRQHVLAFTRRKLLPAVTELVRVGWQVEADGAAYRAATGTHAAVRSVVRSVDSPMGIDWFELDARVHFGDEEVELPALLDALDKGETTIALADGSIGLLPAEWLARLRPIAATGASSGDVTRFARSQVALLDALLATIPDVSVDETFETARAELHAFDSVTPRDPPPTFHGTLREYQREGLGWFNFLRRFRLGGCLADDMGLGKTVQVLALLEQLRIEGAGPSIVVVPRSLVFNWKREAERFAPRLRVVDYTGTARALDGKPDLVITTYGTLRRDAPALASVEFEYAILDEAQAIKNAKTAASKAARLLKARHRLALSGTPIENRLDELWSLFEFLNPGMLGPSSTFGAIARLMAGPSEDDNGRELLSTAMRPVILRRTKDQVAPELPPRVEQTLEVELEPAQRRFYDGLLARYRESVLERVDRVGIQRARMHVLEALLRLRQAACHPVLADPSRTELPSAKLDALMPALAEIVDEGHKAVVFSQFTKFLALVRHRLDQDGVPYEYLDGQTRDRESRVDRFQSDPAVPLFLVSLKAGGHGLNLTAADYVYLLDPWWNPAVEAQAIDRTHRIGQTRRVIATRLVARATIEEKILALQASKRALADAILAADNGVLAKIGREELEALLEG